MSRGSNFLAFLLLLTTSAAVAQSKVGIVEQPCAEPVVPTPALRDLFVELFIESRALSPSDLDRVRQHPDMQGFGEALRKQSATDWAALCRYQAANAVVVQRPQRPVAVFMGDSITENWQLADPKLFEAAFVNRGISGQTTSQMLVRFRADVVALKPKMVHIMAGTNDIAGNTGAIRMQDVQNNIMSMVDLALTNDIQVALASIPPAAEFNWRPDIDPVPVIQKMNDWLRTYAKEKQLRYIDYYSALAGASGELKGELGNDGVHPNRRGYEVMRQVMKSHGFEPR